MALDTPALFNRIQEALTEHVLPDADRLEWFEDPEPGLAAQMHAADLGGAQGQSILFGMAPSEVDQRSGTGTELAEVVPVSIVLVRLRGEDFFADGQALNRLQDTITKLFNPLYEPKAYTATWYGAMEIRLVGRGPLGQTETWIARQLRYDFIINVVPTNG